MTLQTYYWFLAIMAALALVVFVALYFVEAGYGYLFNPKFGRPISNKIGWVLMESPVFFAMAALWLLRGRRRRWHWCFCSRRTISNGRSSFRR